MIAPAGVANSLREGYYGDRCSMLCWMPAIMGIMAITLSIACLFFMALGGLVLCILNCLLGFVFAGFTYGVHVNPKRPCPEIGALVNALYMVLLLSTFAYAAWLLAQNKRAENEKHIEGLRPLVNPFLDAYIQHAGVSDDISRRLDAPASASLEDFRAHAEAAFDKESRANFLLKLDQRGPEVPAPSSTSSLSIEDITPEEHQTRQYQQSQAALRPLAPSHRRTLEEVKAGSTSYRAPPDEHSVGAQHLTKDRRAYSSTFLNPVVLPQGWATPEAFTFTSGDLNCLMQASQRPNFASATTRRFHALLDRGLFCGYTQYAVDVLRKWPVSCDSACHFGQLHFSRYRKNEEKTKEQAQQFLADVQAMNQEQAKICVALATVTACRIEERQLHRAVATALVVALILCIILFFCSLACSMACVATMCRKPEAVIR